MSRPDRGRPVAVEAAAARGTVLFGALFRDTPQERPETVVLAITGIHGNFYSNPFYVDFGAAVNAAGAHFVYAQTCDAFGEIPTRNARTGAAETAGSWNERFAWAMEDVAAWVDWAVARGYRRIVLAGHSLGANKMIRYLSSRQDPRVDRFLLLSPANVRHLAAQASAAERALVRRRLDGGRGGERLPFELFGWIPCVADTAGDWLFSDVLDNVHPEPDGDFSQVSRIGIPGGLLIGSLDVFAGGEPVAFLRNLAAHFPDPARNRIVVIPGTGHTYQGKAAQTAREIAELVRRWRVGTPERRSGLAAMVPSW